jgi:hypothetical protein
MSFLASCSSNHFRHSYAHTFAPQFTARHLFPIRHQLAVALPWVLGLSFE